MLLIEALKKLFLSPWFAEIYSDWLLRATTLHGKESGLTPRKASALNGAGAMGEQAPARRKTAEQMGMHRAQRCDRSGIVVIAAWFVQIPTEIRAGFVFVSRGCPDLFHFRVSHEK